MIAMRGSAAAKSGALDAARRYFERSVALDPKYAVGLKNVARVYMELGEFAAAHEAIVKLSAAGKLDGETVLIDGQALRRMGHSAEARLVLTELAQTRPDDARVFRELGLLYADDLNDLALGRRYLSRSLALDSSQVDLMDRINGEAASLNPVPPEPV